jgi:hypothetical protein
MSVHQQLVVVRATHAGRSHRYRASRRSTRRPGTRPRSSLGGLDEPVDQFAFDDLAGWRRRFPHGLGTRADTFPANRLKPTH